MWPDTETTQELLSLAAGEKDGNDDAVGRLLERHRPAIRRLIDMRLDQALKRRVDASDIIQDVMIEAHRRLEKYMENPVMPFHLWLRQIAKDRIIDMHRRHRVAARRSIDREQPLASPRLDQSTVDLAGQLTDRELTPASTAMWEELNQRFQSACDELEENDREIVLMRHFEQLSNQETAAAIGVSPQAASMRYLRAMRRLRELLADEESFNDT